MQSMPRPVAVLAVLLAAGSALALELVDRIVAVVDNQVILWSELNVRLQQEMEQRGVSQWAPQAQVDSLRRVLLEEMIDENVLVLRAEADSIEVDPGELEERVNERLRQVKSSMSEDDFQRMLQQANLTERDLKHTFRRQIRQILLFRQMRSQVAARQHITRRDLQAFREAHRDTLPLQISLSHINLKVRPSEEVLARKRQAIEAVERRLAEGGDFAELARQHSEDAGTAEQGGDLGCFGPGQLMPEFEQAAAALKPGEVSRPVLTQSGYHLIQLREKREGALCASHILVLARSTEEDRQRVRGGLGSQRPRAQAGEDFAALARAYSQNPETARLGGMWDVVPRDQVPPYLQARLRGLKLGDISQPFFLDDGGHILKINDDQATLEMLIREQRTAEAVMQLVNEYEKQLHVDRRLGEEYLHPPGNGTLGRLPEEHGPGQAAQ
ncbi:MAG: peptidylprolyl isomerase [Candidatus Latescibacterota bacterium]